MQKERASCPTLAAACCEATVGAGADAKRINSLAHGIAMLPRAGAVRSRAMHGGGREYAKIPCSLWVREGLSPLTDLLTFNFC